MNSIARVENRPAIHHGHRMFVTVVVYSQGTTDLVVGSEAMTRREGMDNTRKAARLLNKPIAVSPETMILA